MNSESSEMYAKALSVATNAVMQFMSGIDPKIGESTALVAVDGVAKSIANKPMSTRQNPQSKKPPLDWIAIGLSTVAFAYMIYQVTKYNRA